MKLIINKNEVHRRETVHHHWDMKYNLSVPEILLRYVLMGALVIAGGVVHSVVLQMLAVPVVLTAILGWSPLYQLLGIDHSNTAVHSHFHKRH